MKKMQPGLETKPKKPAPVSGHPTSGAPQLYGNSAAQDALTQLGSTMEGLTTQIVESADSWLNGQTAADLAEILAARVRNRIEDCQQMAQMALSSWKSETDWGTQANGYERASAAASGAYLPNPDRWYRVANTWSVIRRNLQKSLLMAPEPGNLIVFANAVADQFTSMESAYGCSKAEEDSFRSYQIDLDGGAAEMIGYSNLTKDILLATLIGAAVIKIAPAVGAAAGSSFAPGLKATAANWGAQGLTGGLLGYSMMGNTQVLQEYSSGTLHSEEGKARVEQSARNGAAIGVSELLLANAFVGAGNMMGRFFNKSQPGRSGAGVLDEAPMTGNSPHQIREGNGARRANQITEGRLGKQSRSDGDGNWFAKVSEQADHTLPAGHGSTDKLGNVRYSPHGTPEQVALARAHEGVHSFFSPKFLPMREQRATAAHKIYQNVHTMRYIEEALCETYAQLNVFGLKGVKNVPGALNYPFRVGEVQAPTMLKELAVGGTAGTALYKLLEPSE